MTLSLPVLQIEDLNYYFYLSPNVANSHKDQSLAFRSLSTDNTKPRLLPSGYEIVKAIDGLTLTLHDNECIGVIGETGSGKSTLIYSILNLPFSNLYERSGTINYYFPDTNKPIDLFSLSDTQMQKIRAFEFGFVPQLPKSSLNPWLDIGFQVGEVLFDNLTDRQNFIRERINEFLGKVAFPTSKKSYVKYVSQLSRGEAQRVCIAQSLMTDPRVLLADEPFTALDAITSNQIVQLFKELQAKLKTSFLFNTHNITAAWYLADTIAVIYGGEIVEVSPSRKFFDRPLHPYSQGLLEATPWYVDQQGRELKDIPGDPPISSNWPSGCKFHPRCAFASSKCVKIRPKRVDVNGVLVNCHLYS
ncbi:MAG: ABC transporter ATP-binding protein [Candidatus Hodarchaeales archaeon]